jgi:tRNA threonylcarbamoyladenosine biosynthesis protein TsaB
MDSRILIIETSGAVGQVGLAVGSRLMASRRLDEARRHARDLAPSVAELLKEQGWKAKDVQTVIVSRGPGSYTGLRVGIMSAKTFAYATGCFLLTVDTFAAIASNSPVGVNVVAILADAQQRKVYAQRFRRIAKSENWQAETPLAIQSLEDWKSGHSPSIALSGPGLEVYGNQLATHFQILDQGFWHPTLEGNLGTGLARLQLAEQDDLWNIEPLYLRASSAEEQRRQKDV